MQPTSPDPDAQASPARTCVGWTPQPLGIVAAVGPDAVRFIDNFTTAAVSPLAVGDGTEAFFTDARGWVLALATILRTETGLLITTDAPSVAAALREHLEHYHIRERLELDDRSADSEGVLVAGPGAAEAVAGLCGAAPPPGACGHAEVTAAGVAARVVRVTGRGADGYRLLIPAGRGADVAAALTAAGVPRGDSTVLEALRIAACYPSPADILPKTLPQELGRDARAISFTKGCYLGQETVARLDALGHVNRRLAALEIAAAVPPAVPVAVVREGTEVGTITSACRNPAAGGSLCLGLVQVRALDSGGLEIGGVAARPCPREAGA